MKFLVGPDETQCQIDQLIVAGWTGRDADAVQHHIDELAVLGVAPPSTTPLFYEVSAALLTQDTAIQVLGDETSGEAEPLLVKQDGAYWLGLASDHTDRDLETTSVAASKQACAKVCGRDLWPFEAVRDHLDQLHLRSWINESAGWQPYQDGTLAQILPLTELAAQFGGLTHAAMLCGTLPAIGGVRPAGAFRAELRDPIRDRSLTLEYSIETLRVIA